MNNATRTETARCNCTSCKQGLSDHDVAESSEKRATVAGCSHGVPTGCYCRWCTEGGQPSATPEPTDTERAVRRAQVRADFDAMLAAIPSKPGRRSRRSK